MTPSVKISWGSKIKYFQGSTSIWRTGSTHTGFSILCNEAFGYSHEKTLDSSLVLILSMLREHGYLVNDRNKAMCPEGDSASDDPGEWTETIDFATGQKKRVRKMRL